MTLFGPRIQYAAAGLELEHLARLPHEQFSSWFDDAVDASIEEPNAFVLSTVDHTGASNARVVLARGVTEDGIVFYTNYLSAKSRELSTAPEAAATFAWLKLHRQVRVRGNVHRVSDSESDAYFAGRPRESQLGAWASPQSEVIADRSVLDTSLRAVRERFGDGVIPRPPHWGGWRIVPEEWEFWQGRENRLHDRFRYRRDDASWQTQRLAP